MTIKKYTEAEARALPGRIAGPRPHRMGWLWRKDTGTWKWTFTTTLNGRSYPSTAEFVPVYVEETTRV